MMDKDIEQLFTDLVNNLARLDMKYTFTMDEHDEFLKNIEKTHIAVNNRLTQMDEWAEVIEEK